MDIDLLMHWSDIGVLCNRCRHAPLWCVNGSRCKNQKEIVKSLLALKHVGTYSYFGFAVRIHVVLMRDGAINKTTPL